MAESHASDSDFKRAGKPYKKMDEHWELKYHSKKANDVGNQKMGADFDPLCSKYRYKTYNMVNETDT